MIVQLQCPQGWRRQLNLQQLVFNLLGEVPTVHAPLGERAPRCSFIAPLGGAKGKQHISGPLEAGAAWGSPRRRHLAGLTTENRSHVLLLALLSTFLFHDSFYSPGIWNGFQLCAVLTAQCLRSLQLLPGLTYGFVSGAAKIDFEGLPA